MYVTTPVNMNIIYMSNFSKIWKFLKNCAMMGEFRYTTPLAPNGSTRLFDVPPIISHVITFLPITPLLNS